MKWPWSREADGLERRDYADIVLQLLQARADGEEADLLTTAAVEQAAGAVARAFASVTVDGAAHVVEALTPAVLGRIGRDVIRHGESVHAIDVRRGRVALAPVAAWTMDGGHDPRTWRYDVQLTGPTMEVTRKGVPASGIVHVRWASEPQRPHEGTSAATYAAETARTASRAERSIGDEAGAAVGSIVALPESSDTVFNTIKAALDKLRGEAIPVETAAAGWADDRVTAPKRDWGATRIGGAPPQGTVTARQAAQDGLLGAFGVPAALYNPGDGTAAREGLRRFWIATVIPLLRALCFEARAKLEGDCQFRFDPYVLDVTGRASALKALTEAGVELADARTLVGLEHVGVVR